MAAQTDHFPPQNQKNRPLSLRAKTRNRGTFLMGFVPKVRQWVYATLDFWYLINHGGWEEWIKLQINMQFVLCKECTNQNQWICWFLFCCAPRRPRYYVSIKRKILCRLCIQHYTVKITWAQNWNNFAIWIRKLWQINQWTFLYYGKCIVKIIYKGWANK